MFNPFQIYDAMLGINHDDDYDDGIETIFMTREIPEELADEFNAAVDNLLAKHGYDTLDFDSEEE